MGKKFTIDRFISEEEKQTTIYDITDRFESGKNAKYRPGCGRPAKNFQQTDQKKLESSDWSIDVVFLVDKAVDKLLIKIEIDKIFLSTIFQSSIDIFFCQNY